MPRIKSFALLAGLLVAGAWVSPKDGESGTVASNDNRQSSGQLRDSRLTLALEARSGTWYPEGRNSHGLDSIAAFAEAGGTLTTPGPLIRVPAGTVVQGTLHNTLDRTIAVFGLSGARRSTDSLVVAAGATAPFAFTAGRPGTYYYFARSGLDELGLRPARDAQLQGAIVVDGPHPSPDRILAISWYSEINPRSPSGLGRTTMVINGQSWPHTERLQYAQGDSIRWRVINFTELDHPMHLHGFYFRVNAKGDGVADTLYAAADQRMAVTEVLPPFQTMELAWKADRSGNWVFHCHYAVHLSGLVSLDTENGVMDSSMLAHHGSDRPHQMFGLVMGISVAPKGAPVVATDVARVIRIEQREKPGVYGKQSQMSFVVDGTPESKDPSAMPVSGPMLVLERGKRVAVTIVNRSNDHAAVHWHGIELESYPDGVPGWSGSGQNILPAIGPGDSLTVRWTPPRAGSFMYHTHFSEVKQMGAGLYGPIIVLEPGERFDPETDRVFFFGTAGSIENVVTGPFPSLLMNGQEQPAPMELKAGKRYRFRFFNLAGDAPTQVSLNQGDQPVPWKPVAKDGYPLPASQTPARPAVLVFDPGEIYDFEFTPAKAGALTLKFGLPPAPPAPTPPAGSPAPPPPPPTVSVAVIIKE